jgi:NADPH2:quinone reductase
VIGCVGTPEKAAIAKKAGARHTILYRDEDFAKRVDEVTKGAKYHVVHDGVGKATFPGSLDCLRPLGVFASFGAASGGIDAFNIGVLAQKLAVRDPADLVHLHGGPGAGGENSARSVRRGRPRRGQDPWQKWPLAEAGEVHSALEKRETTGSQLLAP